MKGLSPKALFTSPEAVSRAFYEALEARDIEAMMAVWADDEEVICVHPGGVRLTGFDVVRSNWEKIFASGQRLRFHLESPVIIETVGMAVQNVLEYVVVDDEPRPRGASITTNVFLRTPTGWRMVMHHAAPLPRSPSEDEPPPRQLH